MRRLDEGVKDNTLARQDQARLLDMADPDPAKQDRRTLRHTIGLTRAHGDAGALLPVTHKRS